MPRRSDDTLREAEYGGHPPTCTCVECVQRRLTRFSNEKPSQNPPSYRKRRKRSRISGTAFPILLILLISIAIIVYTISIRNRIGQATVIGIVSSAGIITIWSAAKFRWLWRYRLHKAKTRSILFAMILIALIGCTAVAFAGVEPISSIKDRAASFIEQSWQSITAPPQSTVSPTVPIPETTESSSSPTKLTVTVQDSTGYTDEEVEELVYILVNNERQVLGLRTLREDTLLVSLAKEHSINMATHEFFSHDRITGERDFGYRQPPNTARAENIAQTPQREWIPGPYLTLEEICEWVVSGWMDSIGHRENILEARFTNTGVGVSRSGGYLYITQIFEGAY